MATSTKGAGTLIGPLAVSTVLVVCALVLTFVLTGEEPPAEATVVADDDLEADPTGAGTTPEAPADEVEEGISDELDEVDPAAPDVEEVPPADLATSGDDGTVGETDADETVSATDDTTAESGEEETQDTEAGGGEEGGSIVEPGAEATTVEETGSGGADGNQAETVPAAEDEGGESGTDTAAEDFLLDEDSGSDASNVDQGGTAEAEDAPAGRDAQTELTPEPGQDVVEDTDQGGTSFIPTPTGPEGRDDETVAE